MIMDVNTSLGRWPFQQFAIRTASALVRHLQVSGIGTALVSSMDAILYPDPMICDAELFRGVKNHPMLIPVPTVNPTLSNWRAALAVDTDLRAVRIIPNYHNYPLNPHALTTFMQTLEALKIPLMIQMRVDDERNQYPLMKVPGVNWETVAELANAFPNVSIVCLCAFFGEAVELVQKTANVSVDISFVEKFRTLPALLEKIPSNRILFGSHTPWLYTQSAVMKLEAIRQLDKPYQAIAHANAKHLFTHKQRNSR